jgi:hypothetical protein
MDALHQYSAIKRLLWEHNVVVDEAFLLALAAILKI